MLITIKDKPGEILPYLSDISAGADTAKEELGFWPSATYQSFAASGKLLVATVSKGGADIYAGHLMFGGLFPQARIFQLFVSPMFRGHGIAGQLVVCLKERLTAGHWLSIVAKVADDLVANSTWGRMGFRVIRTKSGGSARNRRINVRAFDLETPSLLTIMAASPGPGELRFADRYSQRPIYLFDLNVLFDVVRKRPRSEGAAKVVWAGLSNSIRLMVAAEFAQELLRTSKGRNDDPILAFASRADSLSQPPEKNLRSLILNLAPIIFPERHRQDVLTEQDRSDLKHVATAIYHQAAGFITSENAILRARLQLLEIWNLDVIGVEEFGRLVEPQPDEDQGVVAELLSGVLRARRNLPEDLPKARDFLESTNISSIFVEQALIYQGSQVNWMLIGDDKGRSLGYAKWEVYGGVKRTADVFLSVDETSSSHESIIDYILDVIPRELSGVGPTLVRLNIPSGEILSRQSALAHGFYPPVGANGNHVVLQRVALGKLVMPENWQTMRQSLIAAVSLSLPLTMPNINDLTKKVMLKVGEREIALSLSEIERALSPVLFLFFCSAGVIVPIREHFARDLIGASPQFSMLAPPEAILRRERVYVSAPKTVGQLKPGTPILFYESQKGRGRGCMLAIARITESRVVTKADALNTVQRRGVLDSRSLDERSAGQTVTETFFDNIFVFKNPVSLKRLRELGCVDGANLISAKPISFETLIEVVKEGRVNG